MNASAPTRLARPPADARSVDFSAIAGVLEAVDHQIGGEAVVSSDATDAEAAFARRATEGA